MNMKQAFLPFALSAALVASADITGLTDLTDDLSNRAAISGNDNIEGKKSDGAYAFNLSAAQQVSINNDNYRLGGGGGGPSENPLWVTYEFKTNTVVNAYRIWNQSKGYSQKERSPKDFYFEGSLDGSAWVTLDNQTNQKAWGVGEPRVFEFDNKTAYKFYRMTFTSNVGGGDAYIMIQELEYFCRPQFDHSLTIEGIPANYGEPSLRYGTHEATEGETFEVSVETPVELSAGRQLAGCVGWATSVRDAEDASVWNELDAGEGHAVSFTHPGGAAKLVWKFAISNMIEAASHGVGTVSGGGWCLQDERMTLKATAGEGYDFIRWIGDTAGVADSAAAEITVVADAPRKLTAFFVPKDGAKVLYVSPEGDDENDGASLENAKASVGAAVEYLDQTYMEGTVFVAPGIYEQSKQMVLSNAIEVVGMTGKPQDVVLRNTVPAAGNVRKEQRIFHVRNAKALVTGMTLESGSVYDSMGGNVYVSGAGGTVSNCVIRLGFGSVNAKGANVALASENALVSHCTISDGALAIKESQTGVAVFFSGGGRLSNCLITRNATKENTLQKVTAEKPQAYVVCFNGNGVMDNCTIVDNCHTGLLAAVYAKDQRDLKIQVVNCVIVQNTTSDGKVLPAYSGGKDWFWNCVTDGEINGTCKIGSIDEMFVNANDGKWLPLPGGLLEDVGTTNNLAVPAIDLKGNPRIRGDAIDVGCYEVASAGFIIRIR